MLKQVPEVITPFLLFLLAVSVTVLSELILKKALRKRVEETLADTVFLTLSSIFLFAIGWLLSNQISYWNYRELLRNLSILVSAVYITRAAHLLTSREKLRFLPYVCFILAFTASALFLFFPFENYRILQALTAAKKFFIFLGSLMVVWELSSAISRQIIAKTVKVTGTILLSILFILWEFEYLKFDVKTLMGIAVIVFLTAILTVLNSKVLPFLREKLKGELPQKDLESFEQNLKALTSALYLLILVAVLKGFSNFGNLIGKLYSIYIINTDLVKISVGNLINTVFLGVILFSLLNLGKKLVKLSFPRERREVEGGSAEALIFNLGVLFNVIVLLSSLGITWKVLLPVAGTLGVGLGFGLQTIMNNYVSGFILLFSKKLKVGDILELPSISVTTLGTTSPSVFGKVEDIGILSTIIRTNDGVEISIPNSSFINSPIVNFSYKDPYVRLKIPVGVAYSSDPIKVKEILLSVIEELPYTVKFLPKAVRFEELGDSALIFKAIFWIDVRKHLWVRNIVSDFYYKAWYKLKEAGIEIPFPQNDIWFRNSLKVEIEKPSNGGIVDKSNPGT